MNPNSKLPDAMTDPPTCPVCGAPLARGQDGDLCPACLLGAAMGDDLPDQSASSGAGVAGDHGFPSIAERLGARIGRYKLLEQIGEGGFGVVWMAEQEEPVRRRVALKIIKPGMDTREVVARFEAERQALAMMEHPNIASVFDGGATDTGRPYFVMELVKGVPITSYCDANQLSTRDRLELFMDVCHAVQHAHQKGVIHRDLKPSNILVTVKDDRAAPKVIDFGVAKATQARLTENTLFTRLNQWIGTPEYMSPEQAGLGSLDVDTRSDIYSLGVLLYELLTGWPPFDTRKLLAAGYDAVMRIIREEEPPRPSTRLGKLSVEELTAVAANRGAEPAKLNRLVRGDLDWIVMKALEKDRRRRYETANGLADDLQHHLHNEPVVARPPNKLYWFAKLVRRNKLAFGATGAVAAAIVIGFCISTWSLFQKKKALLRATIAEQEEYRQRVAAEEARGLAEHERIGAKERLIRLSVSNGTRLLGEGDDFGALLWFAEALHLDPGNAEPEANHRLRMASILRQCPMPLQMWFHAEMVNTAVFSPDDRSVLTASRDKSARVWDALTGEPITPPLLQGGDVLWAGFSPDGKRVFTATGTGVSIWDARTGKPLIPPIQQQGVIHAELSRDGEKVVTASSDGTVGVWNAATGEALLLPLRHRGGVNYASFSPDGRRFVTASNDNTAQIWDLTTGQPCLPPLQHTHAVQQARFDFDGSRVITTAWNNTARIWDAATGRPTTPPMPHYGGVFTATFSPDGRWVVTASNDMSGARVWNAVTGKLLNPPMRHPMSVLAANFNPAGNRVVTSGFDGTARVLDVATGRMVLPLLRHGGMVNSAVFSSDGRRILTTSSDGTARLWDIEPHKLSFAPWTENDQQILGASRDGTRLITRNAAKQVRIWDTDTWRAVSAPIRIENPVRLTLSRDLTRLVAVGHDAAKDGTQLQFKVWELATARLISQTDGPAGTADNVHFSADGRLALLVRGSEVERWDITQGKLSGPPLKHPSPVSCVVFSADARRCATSNENLVHVWDTATGTKIHSTLECPNDVSSVSFSPDDGYLATACSDFELEGREARVWDLVTGKPVTPPMKHADGILFVAFSPDGRRVVTGCEDGTARIWDARTSKPLTSPLPHKLRVLCAAFSADGQRLVTGCLDSTVRV